MLRLASAFAVAAAVLTFPGRATADPKHPYLHSALFEMKAAHKEMKEASSNYGGHKEKALKDLNDAIKQIEFCLVAVGDPYTTHTPAKDAYKNYKNHPHLRHSLAEMKEAHKQLKEASNNFGGHKEKALRDIEAAMKQVEKCIEHAH